MPIEVEMWLKAGQIQVKELDFDGKRCCPVALTKHHLGNNLLFSSHIATKPRFAIAVPLETP